MPWFRDILGITVLVLAWCGWALAANDPGAVNPAVTAALRILAWLVTGAASMRAISLLVIDGILIRFAGLPLTPFPLLLLRLVTVFFVSALTLKYGLGFDIGSLLTTSAVLTGVIGLAMQSTLAGLFSGIALQTEKRIRVGDVLHLAGSNAVIETIGWRSIVARRPDGVQVMVPNTIIATTMVTFSRAGVPTRREVTVPAPLAVPPALMAEIIRGAAESVPQVSQAHAILVDPASFNIDRGSMDMRTVYWSTDETLGPAILRHVWYAYQRHGIVMPDSAMGFEEAGVTGADTRLAKGRDIPALAAALGRGACCPGWPAERLEDAARTGRWLMFAPGEAVALPAGCAGCDAVLVAGAAFAVGADPTWMAPPTVGGNTRVAYRPDPERVLEIQAQFAEAVGPFAHRAVPRAVANHADEHSLYRALADDIPAEAARARFLRHGPEEPMTPFGPGSSFRAGQARGTACRPAGVLIAATHLEVLVLLSGSGEASRSFA